MTRDIDRRIRSLETEQKASNGEITFEDLQKQPGGDLSGFPGETFDEKLDSVWRVVEGHATASPEAMNAGRLWVAAIQKLNDDY